MSVTILKSGILDSIQDLGRYGHQWLGINPGGAMDTLSMQVANLLVGNNRNAPVLEMHFPAATLRFDQDCMMALAGADLSAMINEVAIPTHRPILIKSGSTLSFKKKVAGSRIYLSIAGGWCATEWLNSCSTNLQLGYAGARPGKNDQLHFNSRYQLALDNCKILPWESAVRTKLNSEQICFVHGREWIRLNDPSASAFTRQTFVIDRLANRMGYRLKSDALSTHINHELISSAVTRGTIQLLPDGSTIVLMADHQTTGGYPRIGHVTSTSMNHLSQLAYGDAFRFAEIGIDRAHSALLEEERDLMLLQNACNFKLQGF